MRSPLGKTSGGTAVPQSRKGEAIKVAVHQDMHKQIKDSIETVSPKVVGARSSMRSPFGRNAEDRRESKS